MTDTTEDRWHMERLVRERRRKKEASDVSRFNRATQAQRTIVLEPVTQDDVDGLRGWREMLRGMP